MQAMAKSANSKVIFLPSASTVGSQMTSMLASGEGEHGGMSAAQKYDNNDFGGQGSDFQRAINAHVVENI
jgi:hypothetical protein